ncbi:MAG: FtsX-like permease family protein [Ruminococcaceae bacterium]|nr:FtsX-like permease family protein [Oscillospiraceae bacterium]MBQ9913892.1 ABC transporter permease [Clostridia bacterium]
MMMSFKMAIRSISSNKLRSVLTMLGIIIGVMALVVLVSLVDGATSSVTDRILSLGSNMVTVNISDDKGKPVTLNTLKEWTGSVKKLSVIAPYAQDTATGKGKNGNGSLIVYGTTPPYYDIQDLQLAMGRFLKNTDVDNNSYVCVINETCAEELIGYADCVGDTITLDGTRYTVVGVVTNNENSLTAIFSSGTMVAYVPYTSLLRLSDKVSTEITSFYVGAEEESTIAEAEEAITNVLMERFEEDDEAFKVSSQDILEDTMEEITSILTILLGGIAAISLIVGGIGIMNIMLVTVTERTREIGIRKAIGANRKTILMQFLMEAVVICMLGCAIGIFMSWAILQIVTTIVSSMGMKFSLDLGVVLIAVVFCFVIGVLFGLYPANKAAKMKPIDALHYGG